jgi:hypothetical protein
MIDYISREAVLGCLYKTMESYHVKRNIMDIPAADVRPARWIPTSERLPEAFKPVIVCRKGKDGSNRVEQGMLDVNGWWKVYGTRTKAVKHWMPLPEPPKQEEE